MNFTAKKKNPNRVKAGKKAWAKMKREGKGLAGVGKKKKSSGSKGSSGGGGSVSRRSKLPSLSGYAIVGGAALIITGIGADRYASLIGRMQTMADEVGLGLQVSGTTIVAVTVALKLLSSFWKGFGRRYRGFLRGYGLRP